MVLLTCSYRTKEFIRVGYYVNNEYNDPEFKENPPTSPQYDKVRPAFNKNVGSALCCVYLARIPLNIYHK